MTFLNGKKYEDWMEDWQKNNVHHETDTCPECGEKGDMGKFYSAWLEMDGKRHWYAGHKYCISAYTNRIKKEYDSRLTNKIHATRLKQTPDELDTKQFSKTFTVKKNRYGQNLPRPMTFDWSKGEFKIEE